MIKRFLGAITAISLMATIFPYTLYASDKVLVGQDAVTDSITAYAYSETMPISPFDAQATEYDIVISGTGAIPDYGSLKQGVSVWYMDAGNQVFNCKLNAGTITVENGITRIGNNSLKSGSSPSQKLLCTKITIAETVVEIGTNAFRFHTSPDLVIDIKGKVTSVGSNAFQGVVGTVKVRDEETANLIKNSSGFAGTVEIVSGTEPTTAEVTTVEPTTVEPTYDWSNLPHPEDPKELYAVYTGTETNVTLPQEINGVKMTVVGVQVFKGNTSITSITIPEGYTTLGGATFRGCNKLENIMLPDTMTTIGGNYVFRSCSSLKNINIPVNVTRLCTGIFQDCTNENLVIDIQSISIESVEYAAFKNVKGTIKVYSQEMYDLIAPAASSANVILVSGGDDPTAGTTDADPTTIEPTTIEPTTTEPTTAEVTTVEPTTVAPTTVEPTTVPSSKATVKFETQLGNWAKPSQILYINESGSYSVELTNLRTNSFKNVGFFKYEPVSGYTGEKCKITVDSIDITAQDGTVYNLKLSDMYLNRDPGASSDNGLPNIWNAAGKKAGVATSADGKAVLDGGTSNGIEFRVNSTTTNFKTLKFNLTVTLASDAAPTTAEPTTAEPTAPKGAVMGDLYYADADWFPQMHDYVVIDGDGTYTFNLSSSDGDSEGAIVFVLDFKDALTTNPDLKAELVSIDCNGKNMTIDQSKVKFGHLEQDKNNLRLEIYNYYGATKNDSPIDQDSISFPKGTTMTVKVKVSDFNGAATTAEPTTVEPTTVEPTTAEPTTVEPTTVEPTTVEPTTAEATTMDPEPTTATDPDATTSEPTTATDPDATTAEPTTAGNDAQTTTASPATTKSAGTTVAASTTKAATTTKAASGTTTSTDKTVNTGAEAAVGLTIFMAAGIAGAVALKKRKR